MGIPISDEAGIVCALLKEKDENGRLTYCSLCNPEVSVMRREGADFIYQLQKEEGCGG